MFCFAYDTILYSSDRLTEIVESDVYVCESKYIVDDHSLRGLSKPLKVKPQKTIGSNKCLCFLSVENIIIFKSNC